MSTPFVSVLVAALLIGAGACARTDAPPAAERATDAPVMATVPATVATTTTSAPAPTTSLPPPLPAASSPIPSPGTNKVLVIGDSVILGAQAAVPKRLVGWDVTFDARESRFINNAVAVLRGHKAAVDQARADDRARVEQAYADAGQTPPPPLPAISLTDAIGRVVVIHLCTNYGAGGGFATYIDAVMTYLANLDRVVWVTCAEWSPGQTEANQAIVAAAARYPTIVVAGWSTFSPTPGYTYDDGIHLRSPGRDELAELVALAVGPAPVPPAPPPPTTLPPPTTTTTVTPPPIETTIVPGPPAPVP